MIHPACKARGHNWDNWRHTPSEPDGTVCPSTPDGCFTPKGKDFYSYRRECQNMGCDAVELADRLVPSGRNVVLDRDGSEVFYINRGYAAEPRLMLCTACGRRRLPGVVLGDECPQCPMKEQIP